jgi:hypothetical protein
MQTVTTIGVDIAKSVFQVHGVDAAGQVVVRRPWRLPKDHVDTSTSAVEQRQSSCSIIHARTRRLLRRHNA